MADLNGKSRTEADPAPDPCSAMGCQAPPEATGDAAPGAQLVGLLRTIETQIIPRLVLAHSSGESPDPRIHGDRPSHEAVVELARLVLRHDSDVAFSFVEALHLRGNSLEVLFTDLLAPTARYLGELWKADLADFTQVTIGLWRLQQLLRTLSSSFESESEARPSGYCALLAPMPGDQHSFGITMVAEFFRRAGWDVACQMGSPKSDLLSQVHSEWYDLVGLSVGNEILAKPIAGLIRDLRRASRNRNIVIMVGGPVCPNEDCARQWGADGMASNGPEAVQRAEELLGGVRHDSDAARQAVR